MRAQNGYFFFGNIIVFGIKCVSPIFTFKKIYNGLWDLDVYPVNKDINI